LGLVVVAEGIETCAALELLALLGCDRAQGYFIGRPVAACDVVFDQRASDIEVPVAPPKQPDSVVAATAA
jgi:EAL domain-containing protein (putative c-di-GMP-specific phosphodiesterase class I)